MKTTPPYPLPTPQFDSKRLCALLGSCGRNPEEKFIKIIHVLHLFGKLDELSDLLEKYNNFIYDEYHKEEAEMFANAPEIPEAMGYEATCEFDEDSFMAFVNDTNPENNVKIS